MGSRRNPPQQVVCAFDIAYRERLFVGDVPAEDVRATAERVNV
jgi:hypothetical protein